MIIDRRKYPRFKKTIPVIIHSPYKEEKIATSDISLIGCAIPDVEKYYEMEGTIYLELILSEDESIFCNARVASIYPHTKDAQTYQLNLEFLDLSDADKEKLMTYLESAE